MRILFVFYVPSGGVDTLNRQRCLALRQHGIECHCLYFSKGSGIQNANDIPTFVTSDEAEIQDILQCWNYSAIVIVSAYEYIPYFRQLGYRGVIILEIQGYGTQEQARQKLTDAQSYVIPHANGLLNPNTPHITELFGELFPAVSRFEFNNCIDTDSFTYRSLPRVGAPVIAWLGRFENGDNKNWREFLAIARRLVRGTRGILLWMFEDSDLSVPAEREAFERMLSAYKLVPHTIVLSNVPHSQMADYFSKIGDSGGFLCSTSKAEGAPYAIVEAMSCRCPVLSTDLDGVRSSVIPGVTGKNYKLGDIKGACREARELMENAALRNVLIQDAQDHVRQVFSPDVYCAHFISMLRTLGA